MRILHGMALLVARHKKHLSLNSFGTDARLGPAAGRRAERGGTLLALPLERLFASNPTERMLALNSKDETRPACALRHALALSAWRNDNTPLLTSHYQSCSPANHGRSLQYSEVANTEAITHHRSHHHVHRCAHDEACLVVLRRLLQVDENEALGEARQRSRGLDAQRRAQREHQV